LVPGPLPVQTRIAVNPHDRAKLRADADLRLRDREERSHGDDERHHQSDDRSGSRWHQRSPPPRASTVTESGSCFWLPPPSSRPLTTAGSAPLALAFSNSLSSGR